MALGMLANGASAGTRQELLKTLQVQDISPKDLNQAYLTLLEELPKVDPEVNLGLANSIWLQNDFSAKTPYLDLLKSYFKAQVTSLPFVPSDTALINQWARDQTNGKIHTIIENLNKNLILILMNALYFKGDWKSQFKTENTKDQLFTKLDGSTYLVKMMGQTDTVKYALMPEFEAVQKGYGNGQFTATLVLPKTGSIEEIMNQMNPSVWMDLNQRLRTEMVQLGLPKFSMEGKCPLNKILKSMGMVQAFNSNLADFSDLTPTKISISYVNQDTYLKVDEVGTEAAAVTKIGIVFGSLHDGPLPFICNKPFGIIISENTSGAILFMGRINNPLNP